MSAFSVTVEPKTFQVTVAAVGIQGPAGTNGAGGDVTGPASSVSGNLPMFSGAGGKTLVDSGTSAVAIASAAAVALANHEGFTSGIHGISAFVATLLDDANASAFIATLFGGSTGSGNAVRAVSPTLTTPNLGVASATSLTLSGTLDGVGSLNLRPYGITVFGFDPSSGNTSYRNLIVENSYSLGWFNGGTGLTSVVLSRVADNHLGLSNGSNAQCFSVYNVSGTDYERGVFDWQTTANTLTIGTQKGGAGNARDIKFMRGGSDILKINQYGIDFSAADTFHIGSSYRPHTVYALQIKTVYFTFDSGISITDGGSSGVFLYRNTAGTGWDRMQYGGTSSSFPATKRRNATLETRLADDSAIAVHVSAYVTKAGAISDSDFTNPVDGCHGYDTTNNKHYVRSGGVWKSSAAYT